MPESSVSVIIPARNAEATIAALFDGLRAQTVDRFEVIVVDSGSSDRTVEIVQAAGLATLLHNPGGEPAGSRNLGAAAASGDLLAFTDSDCVPDPEWLARGLAALDHADLVQGRVQPAGPVGPFERTLSVGRASGLFETANLFVRRSAFDAVGGFQPLPGFTIGDGRPFGEDAWFGWRAKRAGASSAFCSEAIVRHAVLPGTASGFVLEHWRRRYFPVLVAAVPELRDTFLWRRWFLGPATARFDLALAGVVLGSRRRPALLLAAPYLASLRQVPRGRRGAQVVADVVSAGALVVGSVRTRTVVL